MSHLTVTPETTPGHPELRTEDPATIAQTLAGIGVRFERWTLDVDVDPDAPSDTILDAYRPHLDRLMGSSGAGSADVLRLRPGNEAYPAIRRKFLDEHIHTEDEVRFFVAGGGHFILHTNDRVYDAHCTQGDLISVPAGIKHWFDAGEQPFATVLRIFTDTSGWTPHYTGSKIAELFPAG
jgi:1,2-dihydroxy-3-keto-5-methylthiopentene dioxygenase